MWKYLCSSLWHKHPCPLQTAPHPVSITSPREDAMSAYSAHSESGKVSSSSHYRKWDTGAGLAQKTACVHVVESAWYHQGQNPMPEVLFSERKCSQPLTLLLCKFLISHKDSGSQGTEMVSWWPGQVPKEEAKGIKSPHPKDHFNLYWSWSDSK